MLGISHNEDFVLTLGIDYGDGQSPHRIVYEIIRGDQDICMAVMHRIATPSNDKRTIENWWLQLGPTCDWESFLAAQ